MKRLLSLLALVFALNATAQNITRVQLIPLSNYVDSVYAVVLNLTNVGSGLKWTGTQLIATNGGVAGTNGGTLASVNLNGTNLSTAPDTLEFTNSQDIKWIGAPIGATARIQALINQATGSGHVVKSNSPFLMMPTVIAIDGAPIVQFGAPFGNVYRVNFPQFPGGNIAYVDTDQNLSTLTLDPSLVLDTNFPATLRAVASAVKTKQQTNYGSFSGTFQIDFEAPWDAYYWQKMTGPITLQLTNLWTGGTSNRTLDIFMGGSANASDYTVTINCPNPVGVIVSYGINSITNGNSTANVTNHRAWAASISLWQSNLVEVYHSHL